MRPGHEDLVAFGLGVFQEALHPRQLGLQRYVLAGHLQQLALELLHALAQPFPGDHHAGLLGFGTLELLLDVGQILPVARRLLEQRQKVGLVLFEVAGNPGELGVVLADLGEQIEVGEPLLGDLFVPVGDGDPMDHVADRGVEAPGHDEKRRGHRDLLGPHAEAEMMKPVARAEKHLPWNKCLLQEFRYRPAYSLERHPTVSFTPGHEPVTTAFRPPLRAPLAESHRTPRSRPRTVSTSAGPCLFRPFGRPFGPSFSGGLEAVWSPAPPPTSTETPYREDYSKTSLKQFQKPD